MSLITTNSALEALCARLANEKFITIDTEFIRETTYWPRLCLIQVAGSFEAVAIDTLAPNLDLTPFFALMKNEAILKIFHAARQDIEIIYTLGGVMPQPLFDTQIAAQVLGLGDQIGYAELVQTLTKVMIDKASRYTDWAKRPLTKAQIDYAIGDVTHLYAIYEIMRDQLEGKKRLAWMTEELGILLDPKTYDTNPDMAYERLIHRIKKPKELAALMALSKWREKESQRLNVPRSRVLKDDTLTEICHMLPQTPESLSQLRSLPKGFERSKDGLHILELLQEATLVDPKKLPPLAKSRQNSTQQRAIIDLLRLLLKAISEIEGVAPRILASNDDLEAIATNKDAPPLHGWRAEIFGEKALALMQGKLAITFKDGGVALQSL